MKHASVNHTAEISQFLAKMFFPCIHRWAS